VAVLNYTTTIAASKTIGEMQIMLAKAGAARIAVEYEGASAIGMAFQLRTPHGDRSFSLPVDVEAMQQLLTKQRRGNSRVKDSIEQAERVAWRVMKDWLAAQLALVETKMAGLDQVMLPYLHVDGERTLYAAYKEREDVAMIESGSGDG
jgi:hypothetical protein